MSEYQGFSVVEGAMVITFSSGVYRQVGIYEKNRLLFAKHGSGYIALNNDGKTSHPNTKWKDIQGVTFSAKPGGFGQLSEGV